MLVSAVAHCHEKNIVHRDLKMENIILSKRQELILIDFGFSLNVEGPIRSNFCGTLSYTSPEIIQKEDYDGQKSDVWALGVLLYRMACGVFPFRGTFL